MNNNTVVLPSEAAQSLAQHLFNKFGVDYHDSIGNYLGKIAEIVSKDLLSKAIQDYWDSLP